MLAKSKRMVAKARRCFMAVDKAYFRMRSQRRKACSSHTLSMKGNSHVGPYDTTGSVAIFSGDIGDNSDGSLTIGSCI